MTDLDTSRTGRVTVKVKVKEKGKENEGDKDKMDTDTEMEMEMDMDMDMDMEEREKINLRRRKMVQITNFCEVHVMEDTCELQEKKRQALMRKGQELTHQKEEQETRKQQDLLRTTEEELEQQQLELKALEMPSLPVGKEGGGEQMEEDEEEEDDDNVEHMFSLLFSTPGESDWAKVSEPYVPKVPSEEEVRKREERRKEQRSLAMKPIILTEPIPGTEWWYSVDNPLLEKTLVTMLPTDWGDFSFYYTTQQLSNTSESKVPPKRWVYPPLACLEWCTCEPFPELQVYDLEIVDSYHSGKVEICGFFAIRDMIDRRRNTIFNAQVANTFTAVFDKGVLTLPTMRPHRSLVAEEIMLEYNLKMRSEGDDEYEQLIQGVSVHPHYAANGPCWRRVMYLSVPYGDHSMVRLKLSIINEGVEATVELQPVALPSQGIDLRCAARTGRIGDEIVLFDGRFSVISDAMPLQFVVATELGEDMEVLLTAISDGECRRQCFGFKTKFHALFEQEVDFQFARVSLAVAWSA